TTLHRWRSRWKRLRAVDGIEDDRINGVVAVEDSAVREQAAGIRCVQVLGIRVADDGPAARMNVWAEREVLDDVYGSHHSDALRVCPTENGGADAPGPCDHSGKLERAIGSSARLKHDGSIQSSGGHP